MKKAPKEKNIERLLAHLEVRSALKSITKRKGEVIEGEIKEIPIPGGT